MSRSTTTTMHCDNCGAAAPIEVAKATTGNSDEFWHIVQFDNALYDLCGKCAAKLRDFMRTKP